MRKRTLIITAMIMLMLASPLIAAEIMPFLKHTGIAGVDFKVYGHNASKSNILLESTPDPTALISDPSLIGVFNNIKSTYNYTSSGLTLKATVRPPILGIEFTGKIGKIKSRYEVSSATDNFASSGDTFDGIRLGLGARMGIIGEIGILPRVVFGVEAIYTQNRLNNIGGTQYTGNSYDVELQASLVASKEIMLKIPRKVKGPEPVTGLPEIPEPEISPDELLLPLCFIPPVGEGIPEDDLTSITGSLEKSLVESEMFKLTEKEELDKVLEEKGYDKKGCAGLKCARVIGRELDVKYVLIGMVSKTDADVYAAAVSFIDTQAVLEPEKKDDEGKAVLGKILHAVGITFELMENAEENINNLVAKLIKEKVRGIYESNKQSLIETKKKELEKDRLKQFQEEVKEKEEDRLKKEEKNKFKLLLVPYAGVKVFVDFIGKEEAVRFTNGTTTCKGVAYGYPNGIAGVVGLKVQFMKFLSLFVEGGFAEENMISGGLSLNFGL